MNKMKSINFYLLYFIVCTCCFSCKQSTIYNQGSVATVDAVLTNYNSWLSYYNHDLKLSNEFLGYDVDSISISKETFLNLLLVGNYFPLKIINTDSSISYKLVKLPKNLSDNLNKAVSNDIIQLAEIELNNNKLKGKPIPNFKFVDLSGNTYDNNYFKGKIVVVKCWFINCTQCVLEIPQLNELANKYQSNNGITFLSLALDSKEKIKEFNKKVPLNFILIPNQKEYITTQLNVVVYPTYFIVNKDGFIVKVFNNVSDLIKEIEQYSSARRGIKY